MNATHTQVRCGDGSIIRQAILDGEVALLCVWAHKVFVEIKNCRKRRCSSSWNRIEFIRIGWNGGSCERDRLDVEPVIRMCSADHDRGRPAEEETVPAAHHESIICGGGSKSKSETGSEVVL